MFIFTQSNVNFINKLQKIIKKLKILNFYVKKKHNY